MDINEKFVEWQLDLEKKEKNLKYPIVLDYDKKIDQLVDYLLSEDKIL